jgi:hypothetical protein
MAQLPIEMWEEVFSYLPETNDFLKVSLVCNKFNAIIGTIPSFVGRLLLKLKGFRMSRKAMAVVMNSQRKYQKIQLEYFENPLKMLRISEKFKDSLECLEISESTLMESNIQEHLMACEKLKTLKFGWNTIVKSRKRKRSGEEPMASLIGVVSQFSSAEMVLTNPNMITKLEIQFWEIHNKNLMDALKHQPHLTEMILSYHGTTTPNLFETQHLAQFQFKLSKLRIKCSLESSENIVAFVNSQCGSLEHLAIKNCKYSFDHPDLEAMEHLKYLSYYVHDDQLDFLEFPESLESLTVLFHNFGGGDLFTKEMPNMEKVLLKLDACGPNYLGVFESVLVECPNLAKFDTILYRPAGRNQKEWLVHTEHFILDESVSKSGKKTFNKFCEVSDELLIPFLENSSMEQLTILNGGKLSGDFEIFRQHINRNYKVIKIFNYPQFQLESMERLHQERPDFRLFTSSSKIQ